MEQPTQSEVDVKVQEFANIINTEGKRLGLTINVTPYITPDGRISALANIVETPPEEQPIESPIII